MMGSQIRPKKGKQRRLRGGTEQGTKHGEANWRRTRTEQEQAGDVTKVAWIGNCVVIGNSSGINQERRQLLDREGESYAGAEGRQNEQTRIRSHNKWRQVKASNFLSASPLQFLLSASPLQFLLFTTF